MEHFLDDIKQRRKSAVLRFFFILSALKHFTFRFHAQTTFSIYILFLSLWGSGDYLDFSMIQWLESSGSYELNSVKLKSKQSLRVSPENLFDWNFL